MFKSHLYGRARDLCREIPKATIASLEGQLAIVGAMYKRDELSVVTYVFHDLNLHNITRRGPTETFKDVGLRFSAATSKFNSNGEDVRLPKSMTSLMLLVNSSVD